MGTPINQRKMFYDRFATFEAIKRFQEDAGVSGNDAKLQQDANDLVSALANLDPGTDLHALLQGAETFNIPFIAVPSSSPTTIPDLFVSVVEIKQAAAAASRESNTAIVAQLLTSPFTPDAQAIDTVGGTPVTQPIFLNALVNNQIVSQELLQTFQGVQSMKNLLAALPSLSSGQQAQQSFISLCNQAQTLSGEVSLTDLGIPSFADVALGNVVPPSSSVVATAVMNAFDRYLTLKRSSNTAAQNSSQFISYLTTTVNAPETWPFLKAAGVFTTAGKWPGATILQQLYAGQKSLLGSLMGLVNQAPYASDMATFTDNLNAITSPTGTLAWIQSRIETFGPTTELTQAQATCQSVVQSMQDKLVVVATADATVTGQLDALIAQEQVVKDACKLYTQTRSASSKQLLDNFMAQYQQAISAVNAFNITYGEGFASSAMSNALIAANGLAGYVQMALS